jgi:hypothetical protein
VRAALIQQIYVLGAPIPTEASSSVTGAFLGELREILRMSVEEGGGTIELG